MRHASPTLYQLWARRLIGFYPACWRERYAEEMLLILEDSPPTLATLLNLFMNIFDVYLHRHLVTGRTPHMLQKMRSNELAIYGAALIFFLAWFVAQVRLSMYVHPTPTMVTSGDFYYTPSPLLVTALHSVVYILLLFILLGGLPILLAACWEALKARNRRALLFCLLSLTSPLITAFLALLPFSFSYWILPLGPACTWISLFISFIGLGISLALIVLAVQQVAPSRRVTYYTLSLATLIPPVMFAGLVALLLWMLPSFTTAFTAGRASSYLVRQGFLLLVMLLALSFSLISLKKGFQAKRVTQDVL